MSRHRNSTPSNNDGLFRGKGMFGLGPTFDYYVMGELIYELEAEERSHTLYDEDDEEEEDYTYLSNTSLKHSWLFNDRYGENEENDENEDNDEYEFPW